MKAVVFDGILFQTLVVISSRGLREEVTRGEVAKGAVRVEELPRGMIESDVKDIIEQKVHGTWSLWIQLSLSRGFGY